VTRSGLIVAFICLATIGSLTTAASAQTPPPPGRIAFVRDGSVWIWENGNQERLFQDGAVSDPRWSPGGDRLLFVRSGNSYSDLIVRDLATQTEEPLTANLPPYEEGSPEYVLASAWAIDPSWAASGAIGFISDAESPDETFNLWVIDENGFAYIPPIPGDESHIDSLSLSPDGALATYLVRELNDLVHSVTVRVRDLASGEAHVLVSEVDVLDPAFAPDGRRVAVVIRNSGGNADIWAVDDPSGKRTRVTEGMQTAGPCWSPDGTWMAFFAMVDFAFQLWAVPFDGTSAGEPRLLYEGSGIDSTSGCSWTAGTP
jgi:TolB protein